jgi:hypothetical protein
MRQTAYVRSFGARTLSLTGPRAVVADETTPRAGAFARAGQLQASSASDFPIETMRD